MNENITGRYIYELEKIVSKLKDNAYFAVSQDNLTRAVPAKCIRDFINGDDDSPSSDRYYSSLKINEIIEGVTSRIGDINNSIESINRTIESQRITIANNYDFLNKKIDACIKETTENINRIDTNIQLHDASIRNLHESVARNYEDLNGKIVAIEKWKNEFRTEYDNTMSTLASVLDAISGDINNLEESNNIIKSNIQSHKKLIEDLTNDVDEKYNSLNTKVTSITNAINNVINPKLTELEEKINNLISIGTNAPNSSNVEEGQIYIQYFD